MSGIVLACLPPGIGMIISTLNPDYMQPLFSNILGQIAIGAAIVMVITGYWLMMKMIEIEA